MWLEDNSKKNTIKTLQVKYSMDKKESGKVKKTKVV